MMDPIRNALFTAKRRRHFDEGGGTAVTAEKKVENVQAKNAEPNYGNIVTSAYENVGRKGFGSEASNIDQPGYDYWVNQLQSGAVKPEDFNTTFAQAAKQSNQTTAADQGQQWKTWFGYAPTQADYDKMLRVALGEAGVNTYDQYRGIYEATGNRLASGAYGSDTMAGLITPKQMAGITRTDAINDLMTSNDPTKQKAYQTAQQALNDYLTEGQNKVLTTQTDWRGFQGGKPSPGTNFENALAPGSQGSAMYNKFYDAENNPSVADKLAGLLAEKGGIYTYNPYTATYAQDVLNKEAQLAQEETGGIAGIQQAGLDFQSQQDAINAAQQNAVQQAQNFDTGIVQNAATDFNYLNPLQNTGIGDWTNMYTGVDYTNPSVGAYTPSVTDFSYNAFDNYTPWSLENRGGRTMAVGGAAPYVPPRKDNWIDRTDKELQKQSMTPEQEDETAEKLERLQDKSKQDRRMFAHGGDPVEHALRLARGGYATEGFVDEPDAAPGESVLLREAVTPRSLAQSWTPPEEAIAAKSPIAAEFMEQYPQRMGEAVVQTVKYPGQLLYGEKSFDPEEAADWANTAAGIAMTGGVAAPVRGAGTVLGAGPVSKTGLFDFSRLHEVPKIAQFDLPRNLPPRGVPSRVTDVVADKDVQNKMLGVISEGQKMGGANWYNAEPLRENFVRELGSNQGNEAFRKYMDFVAATSPRSDVGSNVRNASYYYQRQMAGEGMPEIGEKNPQPYGHMAQRLHQMNAQRVSGAGWDALNNPKPASFVENLVGNQAPVTVDTHAFRLPAIIAEDPRYLETAFQVNKDAPKQNIQKMVESGELPISEAAKRAAYWQAQPKANEYAAMEQYYKKLGNELGLTPAQTQASAWVGGGKLTGLASDESMPFLGFFDERILKTAKETGMDPKDVLKKFIKGELRLKSKGGSAEEEFGPDAAQSAVRISKQQAGRR